MPPVNDNFADATVITGSGTVTGTTVDSTVEAGEGFAGWGSVWYRYDATGDGYLAIDNAGTTPVTGVTTYLQAYTGTTLANLVYIQAGYSPDFAPLSTLTITVRNGQSYYLQYVAIDPAHGPFTLNWTFEAITPPANDLWEDAIALTGASGSYEGQLRGAAFEGNTGLAVSDADVWFSVTPSVDSLIRLDTIGTHFTDWGNEFYIYTGLTYEDLSFEADAWQMGEPDYNSVVSFVGTAGVTYWVQLSASAYEYTVDDASYVLRWNLAPRGAAPPNDDWANAIELDPDGGSESFSNYNATTEDDEPDWSGGATVWFKWVAPSSDLVAFSTEGATASSTGLPFPAMWLYRLDPDFPTLDSLEWWEQQEENIGPEYVDAQIVLQEGAFETGDVFYIQVDGQSTGWEGDFTLTWGAPPVPVIDSISPTTVAPGDTLTIAGSNLAGVYRASFAYVGINSGTFLTQSDTRIQVVVPSDPWFGRPDPPLLYVGVEDDVATVNSLQALTIVTTWPPNTTDPYFTAPSVNAPGINQWNTSFGTLPLEDNYFASVDFSAGSEATPPYVQVRFFRVVGEEFEVGDPSAPIEPYDSTRYIEAARLHRSGPNAVILTWAERFAHSEYLNWGWVSSTPHSSVVRTIGVVITHDGLEVTGVGSPTVLAAESPLANWPTTGYGLQSWTVVASGELSDTELACIIWGRNSQPITPRIGFDIATIVVTRDELTLTASSPLRIGTIENVGSAAYWWHRLFGYLQLETFETSGNLRVQQTPTVQAVAVGDRTLVCVWEIDETLSFYPNNPPLHAYEGNTYAGYHRTLLVAAKFTGSTPTWGAPANLYAPDFVGFAFFSARNSSFGLFFSTSHPGLVNRSGGPEGQVSWNKPYAPFGNTFIDYPDLHDAHVADWSVDLDTLGITVSNDSALLATPLAGDFNRPIRWQRIDGRYLTAFGDADLTFVWWPFGAELVLKQEDGSYAWPVDHFLGAPGWGRPGWGPDIKVRGYWASGGDAPMGGTLYQEYFPSSWRIADGRILANSGNLTGGSALYLSILQYPAPPPVAYLGPRSVGTRSKQIGSSHA